MDMLFDTYVDGVGIVRNKFDDWLDENKKQFFDKTGLEEKDFYFNNKNNLNPIFYQSAIYDTIIETKQAVEALYHNFNNSTPKEEVSYRTSRSDVDIDNDLYIPPFLRDRDEY